MPQNLDMSRAQECIQECRGKLAWSPRIGEGSFLTIEIGDVKEASTGRAHGEFHLWIYGDAWHVAREGIILTGSGDSHQLMSAGVKAIAQKIVTCAKIDPLTLSLNLKFEDGVTLETFAIDTQEMEHWMLYLPDSRVLTAGPGNRLIFET